MFTLVSKISDESTGGDRITEDAAMGEPAPINQDDNDQAGALGHRRGHALRLPVIVNAQEAGSAAAPLRYIDADDDAKRKKEPAMVKGLKELQQLQKQTIAVLEAVKANLEGIEQVLRSPEATRGLEKQQNAATLLAKGFAREAVEQAAGAAVLLPANPEAHLLLSLSLAADQQFDESLAAARKGLALFDRRHHGLAIEAGLLHALAALGCGPEAAQRWHDTIAILPIPVLLEHTARIANCFPSDAPPGTLDEWISRRLDESAGPAESPEAPQWQRVETRGSDIPPAALLAGLDGAGEMLLPRTRRSVLGQIARRLQSARDTGQIIRFLSECLVPLGNRGLTRSVQAMGRSTVKRLLRTQADAMTLHRAMLKLQMAGATQGMSEIAALLEHWRGEGSKVARARRTLQVAIALVAAGTLLLAYVLWIAGAIAGKHVVINLLGLEIPALYTGPGLIALGCLLGVMGLMHRTWQVDLPHARPPLSLEELAFLRTPAVRHSLRLA